MHLSATALGRLLSEPQIELVEKAPLYAGKRHPAWSPLFSSNPSSVDLLTQAAANRVTKDEELKAWHQSLAHRIADIENWPDAASALSELRVLDALSEAGLDAKPLNPDGEATPDFLVQLEAQQIKVEVFSKHEDGTQTQRREDVAQGKNVPGVERTTTTTPHGNLTFTTEVLHPGGVPDLSKPHDSVQANVISKLCAAKGHEHQVQSEHTSVLWMDLSYFCEINESLIDQTNSLISGHSGLTSGAIWHAFYGWKGAPLLEEASHRLTPMGHDGRYRLTDSKKSRLAATLISFEKPLFYLKIHGLTCHCRIVSESAALIFLGSSWKIVSRTG